MRRQPFRMLLIILFYLFGCLFTDIAGQSIEFDPSPPSKQYVFNPSEVTLTWYYKMKEVGSEPTVQIDSGDKPLVFIYASKKIIIDQYKDRVSASRNMSVASLTIKNLTTEDYKNYKISIAHITVEKPLEYVTTLVKGVNPTKPVITCRRQGIIFNTTVTEGDDLECSCSSTGSPVPTVVWDTTHTSHNSTLKIEKILRNETKIYKCVASNEYGSRNESVLQVKVQYPPSFPIVTSTSVTSFIGRKVTFTCTSHGNPVPKYSWKTPDNKTYLSDTFDVMLRNSRQFGVYSCIASNIHGNKTNNITLHQLFVPGKVHFVSITPKTFEIFFKWSEPDNGGSSIASYVVTLSHEGQVIDGENTSQLEYKTKKLKRNTTYTICVTARNIVGNGNESCVHRTTVYEGPPNVPPKPYLKLGQNMITVTWDEVDGTPTNYAVEYKTNADKDWLRSSYTFKPTDERKYDIYSVLAYQKYSVRIVAENDFGPTTGEIAELVVPTSRPYTTATTNKEQITTKINSKTKPAEDYAVPGMVSDEVPATIIIVSVLAVLLLIVLILLFALWFKRRSGGGCDSNQQQGNHSVEHEAGPLGDLYAQVEGKKMKKKPVDEKKDVVYAELSDFDPTASSSKPPEPHFTEYADIQHIRPAVTEEPDYEDIPPREDEPSYASIRELSKRDSIGV